MWLQRNAIDWVWLRILWINPPHLVRKELLLLLPFHNLLGRYTFFQQHLVGGLAEGLAPEGQDAVLNVDSRSSHDGVANQTLVPDVDVQERGARKCGLEDKLLVKVHAVRSWWQGLDQRALLRFRAQVGCNVGLEVGYTRDTQTTYIQLVRRQHENADEDGLRYPQVLNRPAARVDLRGSCALWETILLLMLFLIWVLHPLAADVPLQQGRPTSVQANRHLLPNIHETRHDVLLVGISVILVTRECLELREGILQASAEPILRLRAVEGHDTHPPANPADERILGHSNRPRVAVRLIDVNIVWVHGRVVHLVIIPLQGLDPRRTLAVLLPDGSGAAPAFVHGPFRVAVGLLLDPSKQGREPVAKRLHRIPSRLHLPPDVKARHEDRHDNIWAVEKPDSKQRTAWASPIGILLWCGPNNHTIQLEFDHQVVDCGCAGTVPPLLLLNERLCRLVHHLKIQGSLETISEVLQRMQRQTHL
mmetsp:Transcript_60265/g.152555  ORF Transcript_60265/g.152555 Transcript_60265/m.152555 type:complete len:477 (-) Transcript_60265:177-1607(-)